MTNGVQGNNTSAGTPTPSPQVGGPSYPFRYGKVRETWRETWYLHNEVVAHASVIAAVFLTLMAVHQLMKWVSGGHDPVLFDGTPLEFKVKWLFDVADLVLISAVIYRGGRSLYKTHKGA